MSESLEEARFARSISTEDVEILAPVTIVGLYLDMFMWYVEQERKTGICTRFEWWETM
jgi:hypothetical protein